MDTMCKYVHCYIHYWFHIYMHQCLQIWKWIIKGKLYLSLSCSKPKLKSHEPQHKKEKKKSNLFENIKRKDEAFISTKTETYSYCRYSHGKPEKTAPGLKKLFRKPFTHSQVSQLNSQSIYIQCSVLSSNIFLSLSVSLAHRETCSLHGMGHDDTYQHCRDNPYGH